MRRIALAGCLVALAAVALAQTGCSTLGFTPPRYRLIEEAEAFRDAAAPPPLLPRELAKTPLAEYVLEPGDTLLIQTADFDSPVRIAADQPVLPDGTIELGVYGRPVVAGMTTPQVEAQVAQLVRAKEGKDHPLTVRLVGRQSKVFYVLGEVNSPGSFPLAGRETVLDGLMAAGGLTRAANEKKIILVRPSHPDGCREVLPVCYPQIVQLGDAHTNYQLRPGDRIFVPSAGMLETLFPTRHNKTTTPCCKNHVPCYTGGGGMGCATGGCAPVGPAIAPLGVPTAPPVPAVPPPPTGTSVALPGKPTQASFIGQ